MTTVVPGIQVGDHLHHLGALAEIEARRGLVEHDDRRLEHDDRRERQKLARPAVQEEGLGIAVEPEALDHRVDLCLGFGARTTLSGKTEQQLLAHRLAANLPIGVLEQKAHLRGELTRLQLRGRYPVNQDLARRRLQKAVYQAHRGGFPRAVRSDEGDEIPITHREAHVP